MEKLQKIGEAQSYLDKMQQVCDQPKDFDLYLHSFYSSTQGILQDIITEVETKPWHIWYENSKESSPVFEFFSDEKNLAHHFTAQVIQSAETKEEPASKATPKSSSFIGSLTGWLRHLFTPEETAHPDRNPTSGEKELNIFHFDNWPGNERALSICRNYLYEITQVVKEGQNLGYIS